MTCALRLDLQFLEPVVLTEGSSQAQGHQCLNYVPGTSLLGSLAGRFDPEGKPEQFQQLFLCDQVRFLNAYPVLNGNRCLPTPMSLATIKGENSHSDSRTPVDRVRYPRTDDGFRLQQQDYDENVRFESLTDPFIDPTSGEPHTLKKGTRTHVGIDSEKRARKESILFTYEYLQAGQAMCSYVLCETEEQADWLQRAIERRPRIRIGRSRATGYGATHVEASRADDFQECACDSLHLPGPHEEHVITFLSDYCPGAGSSLWTTLMNELSAALADFEPDRSSDGKTGVLRADTRTRTVRGFKGVWGLPRPPVTALVKGSVLRIRTGDTDALDRLVETGIGRRRNEGFGRIAIDSTLHQRDLWPAPTQTDSSEKTDRIPQTVPAPTKQSAAVPLRVLRRRQARRTCRDISARALSSPAACELAQTVAENRSISNTQFTNLRSAVLAAGSIKAVNSWFDQLLDKTSADKWKRVRVPSLAPGPDQYLSTLVQDQLLADDGKACISTIAGLIEAEPDRLFADLIGEPDDPEEQTILTHVLCRQFISGLLNRIINLRHAG
jgi:CRISPR-associated protein Csx10